MRYLILIAMFLGGCAEFTAGRSAVLDVGTVVNDEALMSAEMVICRAVSIGAIERRYMRSQEDWDLWNRLCRGNRALGLPGDVE